MRDVYATVYFYDRAPHQDAPILLLIVIVGASLIRVGSAAILFGLPGRQPAISPASLFAMTPSWWALLAAAVRAVFVPVALLPALIVVVIRVFVSFVSRIRQQGWPARGH